jgi:hypothetical protein
VNLSARPENDSITVLVAELAQDFANPDQNIKILIRVNYNIVRAEIAEGGDTTNVLET